MTNLETKFLNILRESENLDVPALKKVIGDLMNSGNYYTRQMIKNFAPHGMYRARTHNSKYGNTDINGQIYRFKNENEFWNPPSKYCSLGRCNDKNESILYCTNDSETAVLEVKPKKGFISLSVFKPRRNGGSRAMYIGEESLSKVETIKHLFENSEKDPLLMELDSYLDKLFYSNVNNGNQHLYKVSASITQNLMSNIIYESGTQQTMQAMLYSSVEKKHTTFNFVLRPNHAIHLYRLFTIQTLEILENTETSIKLQLIRIGKPIMPKNHPLDNPKIKWVNIYNGEIWEIAKPN
ncbi:MAG: hypothetical protein RLZZ540_1876 [Bacteroidota bacterium]|jgi:hypothetical protein